MTIHDPAEGVRRLSPSEVSRHLTGVALELTPTGGFEAAPGPAPPSLLARDTRHRLSIRAKIALH